jgi:Antibiotic biosynthesis monooxygenase
MSKSMVVRYRTRPEVADENQRLVEGVLVELAAEDPGGLSYAAFRLADGVSFVHIVRYETDDDPLSRSPAFAAFQRTIHDRLDGPPVPHEAAVIGSYRFLDTTQTR